MNIPSFLKFRSPKGGNPISSYGFQTGRFSDRENLVNVPKKSTPEVVHDLVVYKIGYCSKCSDTMYATGSTLGNLADLIRRSFGG